MRTLEFGLIVTSLASLAGCTHTETAMVPPQRLPALAQSQVVDYERTEHGTPVSRKGPIDSVVLHSRGSCDEAGPCPSPPTHDADGRPAGSDRDSFQAPFEAKLGLDRLVVADQERRRAYALPNIERVEIRYDVPGIGSRGGVALTVIGALHVAGGLAAISVAALGYSARGENRGAGAVPLIFGVPLLAVGAALMIPGILVLRRHDAPPSVRLGSATPSIEFGPAGPRLAF